MLEFSDEELAMVQFVYPSIPKAGRYRVVFRYNQLGVSRRPTVLILQGGMAVTARVSLHTNCEAPCYSTVVESANINQDAIFDLVEGQLTVIISLEAINVLIDSLIAIPEEFYAAEIPGGEQFSQECDVTTGIVRWVYSRYLIMPRCICMQGWGFIVAVVIYVTTSKLLFVYARITGDMTLFTVAALFSVSKVLHSCHWIAMEKPIVRSGFNAWHNLHPLHAMQSVHNN